MLKVFHSLTPQFIQSTTNIFVSSPFSMVTGYIYTADAIVCLLYFCLHSVFINIIKTKNIK